MQKELTIVIYRIQLTFRSKQTLAFSMSFRNDANYCVYSFKTKSTAFFCKINRHRSKQTISDSMQNQQSCTVHDNFYIHTNIYKYRYMYTCSVRSTCTVYRTCTCNQAIRAHSKMASPLNCVLFVCLCVGLVSNIDSFCPSKFFFFQLKTCINLTHIKTMFNTMQYIINSTFDFDLFFIRYLL